MTMTPSYDYFSFTDGPKVDECRAPDGHTWRCQLCDHGTDACDAIDHLQRCPVCGLCRIRLS